MIKPFELLLECQSEQTSDFRGLQRPTDFQGNSEMLIFCWFDFVIAVNTGGVTVVGRS
jgi:hypothetical protein